MDRREKAEIVAEMRRMLGELFEQHERGGNGVALARAHGYLDGYMRGVLETGGLSRAELLKMVGQRRSELLGPGAATVRAPAA